MNKTMTQNEMKPKLLHLPKEVIRVLSIKAVKEGTSVKLLMQDILEIGRAHV